MTKMTMSGRESLKKLSEEEREAFIEMTAELRALRLMTQSAMGFVMSLTAALSMKGLVEAPQVEKLGKEGMLVTAAGMFDALKDTALAEVRREVSDDA